MSSSELPLPKLVDMAVGTPEDGCMDLASLHTLLHIIVRKLEAQKSRVELAPDQQRLLNPLLRLLDREHGTRVSIRQRDGHELFQVRECELGSEQDVSDSEVEQEMTVENLKEIPPEERTPSVIAAQEEVREESTPSSTSNQELPRSSIRLSIDEIQDFSNKLEELEQRAGSILPNPEDFQQYLSKRETLKPNEPVDFITLSSRVDTIEISLGKLISTVSNVMLEFGRLEKLVLPYLDSGDITRLKTQVNNISFLLSENFPGFRASQPSERVSAMRRLTIERLPSDFYRRDVPSIEVITESEFRRTRRWSNPKYRGSMQLPQDAELEREIEGIKSVLNGLIGLLPLTEAGSDLVVSKSDLQCEESEYKLPKANFHQKAADAIINLRSVQKEIDEIFEEKEERLAYVERVQNELKEMQCKLGDRSDELMVQFGEVKDGIEQFKKAIEEKFDEFKTDLEAKMTVVNADMDYLKNDAVQRLAELEFEVEDRVDFAFFRTRVPMDLFEMTIAEINGSLKDLKEKLEKTTTYVTDEQGDLLKRINKKLEKTEYSSFQRNVTNRLGLTQLRLNKQLRMQESIEAAGAKLKMSGNLKCISCDHEATMKVIQDIVPINRIPQIPRVVEGGAEFKKNSSSVGRAEPSLIRRTKAPKQSEGQQTVCQTRKLPLDFTMTAVPPKDPIYKTHP